MTEPVLHASEITVRFGGLVALDKASISVPPGSVVGLIGPNGAGKTTLFNVLSGLLRPKVGTVAIAGHDVTRASPQRRAHLGLARTFQRLELFGELSVRENLVVAYRSHHQRSFLLRDVVGLGRRPIDGEDARVDELLDLLGLSEVAGHPAGALPLGIGRLLEVARAAATETKVLLLDEPSSGLDPADTEHLGAVFRRLSEAEGTALLLVEHNVDFVLGLAESVTVLDFGRVIAEGSPDEIRSDPTVQAAYLGTMA